MSNNIDNSRLLALANRIYIIKLWLAIKALQCIIIITQSGIKSKCQTTRQDVRLMETKLST